MAVNARGAPLADPLRRAGGGVFLDFQQDTSMSRPNPLAGSETLAALAAYKSGFFNIGLFSAVINLLMLAPALYMLQVYDRVLASGNQMTLLMLTLMIVGLFGLMGALEWVRSQVVIRLGTQMDMRLNQRVYDAAFEAQLKGSPQAAGQA